MPQSSIKLIWSISACNFCPRNTVRTCQIKPGKLIPKLAAALDLDESTLEKSEGICTCCLADIDMIIRSVAIRGAMRDFFLQVVAENKNPINDLSSGEESLVFPTDSHQTTSMPCSSEVSGKINPNPPSLTVIPNVVKPSSLSPLCTTTSSYTSVAKRKDSHVLYQCILCDKIASSKSHCVEHLICHSAARPFSCAHCSKTYKSRKACREHLMVMHGVEKLDTQIYDHMTIDHDGLKQLEHVCTQYKKIYASNDTNSKQLIDESLSITQSNNNIKEEPKESTVISDQSKTIRPRGSISHVAAPLPPLIQCAPSITISLAGSKSPRPADDTDPNSPPAKRNRKGTPHKVVADLSEHWGENVDSGEFLFADTDSNSTKSLTDVDHDSSSSVELPALFRAVHDPSLLNGAEINTYSSNQSTKSHESMPRMLDMKSTADIPKSGSSTSTSNTRKSVPPCEVCGRSFPTREKMADHKRSHSEIKQFSCLMCNRFFKYRRGVTNHLKEVHRLTDRNEISSLVASHEIGCIPVRDASGKKHWVKQSASNTVENSGSIVLPVTQKVIQDTLSSLIDVEEDGEDNFKN